MKLGRDGWIEGARRVESPNLDERPEGAGINLLLVHSISLPPGDFGGDAIEALFTNRLECDAHRYFGQLRDLRVSAHFLVRRTGEVVQFVATGMRAWHAGASRWRARERCNDCSIGVELEGTDDTPFADAQYLSLVALTSALRARLPLADVAAHSDVSPARKSDPGVHFDWLRFLAALCA
ncbi:MAG: 1,6-anhydro-N-acetylmuramyl-L-alanine amidase AmpD [Betaproteobacteria bacterium]|nr:1,6-anhydro-N-acetylmuramyl-L-alanine amidase AmpD [Betaproteobacteria bacterium]